MSGLVVVLSSWCGSLPSVGICLAADGDAGGVRARPPRPSTERWLPRGVIRPPWTSDSMTRKESVLGEADGPHAAA